MWSDAEVALRADMVSKCYTLGERQPYRTIREALRRAVSTPLRRGDDKATSAGAAPFWALKDVSFEVHAGEAMGVIGRNGAGKSTLLKVLTRITHPTEGRVELRGRAGSLLEVGTGFHPELTGRENIYLNGAILGMRRAEIDRKFDDIVEFSEVAKFLDTPVKRYSSGMYVRLAFAVAAHLEPEILLVDEVLAVGDLSFQKKCLSKMEDVASSGATVLLVSHNMASIESLCKRSMLLEQGRLLAIGDTPTVVEQYLSLVSTIASQDLADRTDRQGDGRLRFESVSYRRGNGTPTDTVQSGDDVEIVLDYSAATELSNVVISVGIYDQSGQFLTLLDAATAGSGYASIRRTGRFVCRVPRLPLTPGRYYLNLFGTVGGDIADWVQNGAVLNVVAGDFFGTGKLPGPGHGGLLVDQTWATEPAPGTEDPAT